jgi:hypothetical protein
MPPILLGVGQNATVSRKRANQGSEDCGSDKSDGEGDEDLNRPKHGDTVPQRGGLGKMP